MTERCLHCELVEFLADQDPADSIHALVESLADIVEASVRQLGLDREEGIKFVQDHWDYYCKELRAGRYKTSPHLNS